MLTGQSRVSTFSGMIKHIHDLQCMMILIDRVRGG